LTAQQDELAMEALDLEAQISTNRRDATFVLAGKPGAVECMIVRAALEGFSGCRPRRTRPRC
jgi:hypothetical protein